MIIYMFETLCKIDMALASVRRTQKEMSLGGWAKQIMQRRAVVAGSRGKVRSTVEEQLTPQTGESLFLRWFPKQSAKTFIYQAIDNQITNPNKLILLLLRGESTTCRRRRCGLLWPPSAIRVLVVKRVHNKNKAGMIFINYFWKQDLVVLRQLAWTAVLGRTIHPNYF